MTGVPQTLDPGKGVQNEETHRVTVHDLAKAAGVSLATVDRVLNGRSGVRPSTAQKVADAIEKIGFRRDMTASMLARAYDLRVHVLLPDGTNQFMAKLAEATERRASLVRAERGRFTLVRYKAMDASALAKALDAISAHECNCVAFAAIDKPEVHAAVTRARQRGVRLITLVSDLPDSDRDAFVGIDNLAAGRTAGSLMGRFCPSGAKIGLVAGSLGLIDHAERIAGFRQVIETEFPTLEIVGPIEGQDEFSLTYERTLGFLKDHPDLAGLYNVGAGNAGLVMALNEQGRAGSIRVVAHELTGPTRAGLLAGVIDAALDQDPDAEMAAVWAAVKRLVLGSDAAPPPQNIEIKVFLRDNLR